ncbi:MAG: 3',5'-cyclic-nucleotide phosphodiesterase [Thermoanaerobaculia bacterium]
MQIEVLGACGGEVPEFRLTSLLLNERLALDAGSLTRALPIERQAAVRSIVLSHSHVDHIASLPFFIENVYPLHREAVAIYASRATIEGVHRHLFNDTLWPDFTRLPSDRRSAVRFQEIRAGDPFEVAGIRLTPIPVSHTVPTFGFLLEQDGRSVLWSSDTGPTEELWRVARRAPGLEQVFLETSFDNARQELADLSQHLTPRTLARELAKLEVEVPVLLHHLKPASRELILSEVAELEDPRLGFVEQGRTYTFG